MHVHSRYTPENPLALTSSPLFRKGRKLACKRAKKTQKKKKLGKALWRRPETATLFLLITQPLVVIAKRPFLLTKYHFCAPNREFHMRLKLPLHGFDWGVVLV